MNIRTVWMLAKEAVCPMAIEKAVTIVAKKEKSGEFLVVACENGRMMAAILPEIWKMALKEAVWKMALKEAVSGYFVPGPIETAAIRQPFMPHFTEVSEAITDNVVYYQYHYKGEIVATLLKPLKTPL